MHGCNARLPGAVATRSCRGGVAVRSSCGVRAEVPCVLAIRACHPWLPSVAAVRGCHPWWQCTVAMRGCQARLPRGGAVGELPCGVRAEFVRSSCGGAMRACHPWLPSVAAVRDCHPWWQCTVAMRGCQARLPCGIAVRSASAELPSVVAMRACLPCGGRDTDAGDVRGEVFYQRYTEDALGTAAARRELIRACASGTCRPSPECTHTASAKQCAMRKPASQNTCAHPCS